MSILNKILEEIENESKLANEEIRRCASENPLQFDEAKGYARGVEYVAEIIRSHMDDEDNNGWIPVEDGLPEKRTSCLVTVKYNGFMGMYGTWIKTGHLESDNDWLGDCMGGEVIAWRPLPESYKPENRNNNTTKEYQQEVEHLLEEIKSENGYVRVSDLAKRFEEIDKELFKKSSWNLLQILSNINILIPKHFD